MADEKKPTLEELTKQFQGIHDPAERHAFYWAHPELRAVFSEVNFHPRPSPGPAPLKVSTPRK